MTASRQVPIPPTGDQEFIDDFLKFGIGHYYTTAKLVAANATGPLTDAEQRSIGLEVAVLASTAFELLITWFYALQEWRSTSNKNLLVDILQIRLNDAKRVEALEFCQSKTAEEFALAFRVPWNEGELLAKGFDPNILRNSVRIAQTNVAMILSNLFSPNLQAAGASEAKPWMIHMLNKVKHGFVVVTSEIEGVPGVHILTQGSNIQLQDGYSPIFDIDARPESLNRMIKIIGDMAIALSHMITAPYAVAFGTDPIKPALDPILQDLYPQQVC